eukprot:1139866-Pelagomonas_calceolata.AAC.3
MAQGDVREVAKSEGMSHATPSLRITSVRDDGWRCEFQVKKVPGAVYFLDGKGMIDAFADEGMG